MSDYKRSDEIAVISNYNIDPSKLVRRFNNVILYDQSDLVETQNLIDTLFPNRIRSQNSGHSLSNYFKFIIDNYPDLPYRIHFLKSNIFPRHIDEETLGRKLRLSGVVPMFNDQSFEDKARIAYHLLPGFFIEKNNSWFMQGANSTYFATCNEFLSYSFKQPILPEYLLFAPGGNYSTYGPMLKLYPLNFWKFLHYVTTYQYFPAEAYIVERLLFIIFSAEYEVNQDNFDDLWFEKLEENRKRLFQKNLVSKSTKNCWIIKKLTSKLVFELDKRKLI